MSALEGIINSDRDQWVVSKNIWGTLTLQCKRNQFGAKLTTEPTVTTTYLKLEQLGICTRCGEEGRGGAVADKPERVQCSRHSR